MPSSRLSIPALVQPLFLAVTIVAAQSRSDPMLRIVAPTEGTYVSGPARLVAVIDPASAASSVTQVTFFADGRQTCSIPRAPFECDWDAGEGISEHQIRAVATLKNAQRLVATVRTRGVAYAESVDVDVVQVTAVVTDGDRLIRGLTDKDFRVFDDDRPQRIMSFAAENIPLELVAAIDVSTSMQDAIPQVKQAAKAFLAACSPLTRRLSWDSTTTSSRWRDGPPIQRRGQRPSSGSRHGEAPRFTTSSSERWTCSDGSRDADRSCSSPTATINRVMRRSTRRSREPRAAMRPSTPSARGAPFTRRSSRS
jgi:Bacterial Ig domain